SLVTSTSSTASWNARARWGRSRSRSSLERTARNTAVLRPENENSKPSSRIGRGNVKRVGSPWAASRSIAGPPGYPRPRSVATLSNASPAASSRVAPSRRGVRQGGDAPGPRSEEDTSELQSPYDLVCRLLLEKKK